MANLLEGYLRLMDRSPKELDRVFDTIVAVAERGAETDGAAKSRKRLWQPSDIPSPEELLGIYEALEELIGRELLVGESARRIIPVRTGGQNGEAQFLDPKFRFPLARVIQEHAKEAEKIDSPKAAGVIKRIRILEDNAKSKVYYSVARRFQKRNQSVNIYKNVILLYTIDGQLGLSGIKTIKRRVEDELKGKIQFGQIDFEIIKRPKVASKPNGHFHKPADRLRPGVSLLSPGEMWSSLTCLARDDTGKLLAICSGHGATDYYSAQVGDTLSRRIAPNQEQVVATISKLPDSGVSPNADLPILEFDLALAEIERPNTAENILDDGPALQRVDRVRILEAKELNQNKVVPVSKVGAVTQRQTGKIVNNRATVKVVDDLGNAKILKDQIEIRRSGTAFAKFGDSGGLIFEASADDARNVCAIGAITATEGISGTDNFTLGSPLGKFMALNNLTLLEVG